MEPRLDSSDHGQPASEFDPTAPGVDADPHSMYHDLRARCPVAHSGAHGGFWAVTTREDVERVASEPETFSSAQGIIVPRNRASGRRPPLHFDPPEHSVFRAAINPAFRKDRLARLEPIVAEGAARLVTKAVAAGEADAFVDLASPLAATSVGHLLNLPDELRDTFTHHASAFEHAQFRFDAETVEAENLVLYDLSRRFVAERAADPADPDEDVTSGLLAIDPAKLTFLTVDGSAPSRDALVEITAGSIRQLVVAGHGAPALVLANAIRHLALDGELQDRARREPEIVPDLVEELLRLHTPNQGFARTVVRPTTIGGRQLPVGAMVAIPYTAANRDPAAFERPDEVVIGRAERHLAFGFGVHICPGSHLGRRQTVLLLESLLAATSHFEVAGEATWAPFPVHGPITQPLRLTPAHFG
ncbi:MAG: cytochrome P450 [Acidimicrobiales bacterium]